MNDRRGNPSDPDEEAERVRKAYENVENWGKKYGAEFSGDVSMQMGSGKKYMVPIGDREIAQKIVSRPLPVFEAAPVLPPIVNPPIGDNWRDIVRTCDIPIEGRPHRSWFNRLIDRIFGENT